MADGHVFLETERLILRRFTGADADQLFALDDDPEVMRYITGGPGTPLEEIEQDDLPHFIRQYETLPGWGFWAAIERSTGAFLGWFHLRPDKAAPADEPELGYRLHRSAWGQGYATEGSRALIDKAFGDLGARRVVANAMVVNGASWRVMEKSGMRRVRIFRADWPVRIEGDEEGDVEYAITREEWLAGQSR
jgi:RimJ/RimL family protein N-acetyltransferase